MRAPSPRAVQWGWTAAPLLLALAVPALAADADKPACPPGSHDVACQPQPRSATPPDAPVPESGSGSTAADPDLSDRLSETRGIVAPPPTGDTEIHRPVPPEGRTPIIPPPGSPGGNPNVVPK